MSRHQVLGDVDCKVILSRWQSRVNRSSAARHSAEAQVRRTVAAPVACNQVLPTFLIQKDAACLAKFPQRKSEGKRRRNAGTKDSWLRKVRHVSEAKGVGSCVGRRRSSGYVVRGSVVRGWKFCLESVGRAEGSSSWRAGGLGAGGGRGVMRREGREVMRREGRRAAVGLGAGVGRARLGVGG